MRHLAVCGVLVLGAIGCKSNNNSGYSSGGCAGQGGYSTTSATYPPQGTYTPSATQQQAPYPGTTTTTYPPMSSATPGATGGGYGSSVGGGAANYSPSGAGGAYTGGAASYGGAPGVGGIPGSPSSYTGH